MGVWDLTLIIGSCVLLLAVNGNAKYMNNFLQQNLQAGEKSGFGSSICNQPVHNIAYHFSFIGGTWEVSLDFPWEIYCGVVFF